MYYNDFIKRELKSKGAALVGFAELTKINLEISKEFKYGIVIAIAADPFVLSKLSTGPHIYYCNELELIDKNLKQFSLYAEEKIEEKGFKAFSEAHALCNDHCIVRLPNKTIATRAGIGWIGKNAELVNEEYGNGLRTATVLTNMPIKPDKPINYSKCGQCMECVKVCSAKAIKNINWNIKNNDNSLINSRKCREKEIERGLPFNLTKSTCDICISVCPYTQRYIKNCMSDEYRYFNIKRNDDEFDIEKELL